MSQNWVYQWKENLKLKDSMIGNIMVLLLSFFHYVLEFSWRLCEDGRRKEQLFLSQEQDYLTIS